MRISRDLARAELVHLYREAKGTRALDKFEPDARFFIEDLIRTNGGKLPRLRLQPGRPRNLHEQMLIHLAVLYELDALDQRQGRKPGNISKAVATVSKRHRPTLGIRRVTEIYYRPQP